MERREEVAEAQSDKATCSAEDRLTDFLEWNGNCLPPHGIDDRE